MFRYAQACSVFNKAAQRKHKEVSSADRLFLEQHRVRELFDALIDEVLQVKPKDLWNHLVERIQGEPPIGWRPHSCAMPKSSIVCEVLHPMTCVRMTSFMAMDELLPHHELKHKGWHVVPHRSSVVHLVSHQWLGNHEADPHGVHLRRMQFIFSKIFAGEGHEIFLPDDWESFLKGVSIGSGLEVQELEAKGARVKERDAATLVNDVGNSLIWIDYMSVPELKARSSAFISESSDTDGDFLNAVNSIPAYVERCDYFWICAPSAIHADTGVPCNLNTWHSRGWCRLESWANCLASRSKMPLVVTDGYPLIHTVGSIDFMLAQMGRPEKAACQGQFTCCQLDHRVENHPIPCDKAEVARVLLQLYEFKLANLRLSGQRHMFCLLLCLRRTVYAGSDAQPPPPSPHESLDSFLARIGYDGIDDVDEVGNTALHWATLLADKNLVRRLVAAKPTLVKARSKVGFSPITLGVFRPDDQFPALLHGSMGFEAPEEINAATNNGISLLDRAANAGFVTHVEALLKLRASVDARRKDNGRTPLMSAAKAGYADCCRLLMMHSANVQACGDDGRTALHLATDPLSLLGNQDHDAKLQVARVLLSSWADPVLCDMVIASEWFWLLESVDGWKLEQQRACQEAYVHVLAFLNGKTKADGEQILDYGSR